MTLYSLLYLFFFLPVFIGLYRIAPAAFRRWLIALANIAFIASGGVKGLAAYGVCLTAAFVSGRLISSSQSEPGGIGKSKALLLANLILEAAAFLFFSKGRGLDGVISVPGSFAVAGGAVISLHLASYLVDVYRGCKPSDIGTLTAYSSFFPVMSAGPVLRYRRVKESLEKPKPDIRHTGKGIRIYILGLAEYLLITCRLNSVWLEIVTLPAKSRSGGAAWLILLIWYGAFISGITSMLLMGQGTSYMLGIQTRQPFRRRILADTVPERLGGISVHLTMWIKDYISDPIRRLTEKRELAAFAGVLFGTMWLCFGAGGLAAGALAGAAAFLQLKLTKGLRQHSTVIGAVCTKLITAGAAACLGVFALRPYGVPGFIQGLAEGDTEVFFYLLRSCWLPLLAALFVNGSLLPTALRRMNTRWLSFIMPVIELLLLVLCTAFLLKQG